MRLGVRLIILVLINQGIITKGERKFWLKKKRKSNYVPEVLLQALGKQILNFTNREKLWKEFY